MPVLAKSKGTEARIRRSIASRQGNVVLRSELKRFGSPDQVKRVLAKLVDEGSLIRVSQGAYAKTRINRFTGKPSPAGTLESIASELFTKLKVETSPGKLLREYNQGRTTQVPVQTVVDTGKRRITRKVEVGGRVLRYENNFSRAKSMD